MTRFTRSLLASVICLVMCITANGAEAITLKMGFVDPEGSVYVLSGHKLAEYVAEETGGKINIEIYSGAQLGSERDMYEGCQIGTIDICTVVNPVMSNFIPEMGILDQMFLFDTVEQAHKVIDGKLGQLIAEKARVQGVHLVGWIEAGFRNIFSRRPIASLDDFKGFKLRTMENPLQVASFNALGAIATPMASGEIFTALQQGTIDGNEAPLSNMLTNRWWEVEKNITNSNHLYAFIAICVSDNAWNSIPADLKPAFQRAIDRGVAYQRNLLLETNKKAVEELKALGCTFHEIDRDLLRETVAPVAKEYSKRFNKEWLAVLEAALK